MSGDGFTELVYTAERARLHPFLNSINAPKSFQKIPILAVKNSRVKVKDGGHRRIQEHAPHGNLALRFPAGSADRRHGISLSTVPPVPLAVLLLGSPVHKTTQLLRSPAFLDNEIPPGPGVTAGCSRPLPADTAGKAGRTVDGTTPQLDLVK